MAKYRVHATRDYTVMSNTHLRDKNMSLKAKGLLSVMLALPENWDYSINGLVAICKENNTAVESALKELKQLGYLVVSKQMPNETQSGRFEYIYDIYETPLQAAENQRVEKQGVEKQGVEIQGVEINPQLITNKSITNKLNTNKSSTNEIYSAVVDFLNEKAGTNYKSNSKETQKHINARLAEGFTVDDFKTVIEKKTTDWKGTEWEKYLRPATLFGSKFENYLNAKVQERKTYGQTGVEIRQTDDDELAGIL